MPLPDSFLQELMARSDIESVVSSYVNMKRRGRNLVGLCPFHGEKTPSFTLYPETSSFYCFGCGAGGDVITFIKRIENLDYIDEVRFLADRAGMKMPENDVNDATSVCVPVSWRRIERPRGCFTPGSMGRKGKSAWTITTAAATRIIRFAVLAWVLRRIAIKRFGTLCVRRASTTKSWLPLFWQKRSSRSPGTGSLYDIFRNRVMIPIIDIRGNVIAFGGRSGRFQTEISQFVRHLGL